MQYVGCGCFWSEFVWWDNLHLFHTFAHTHTYVHTCLPGCRPVVCSCTRSCQLQCSSEPLPEDWTRQSFPLPPLEKRKGEQREREMSSADTVRRVWENWRESLRKVEGERERETEQRRKKQVQIHIYRHSMGSIISPPATQVNKKVRGAEGGQRSKCGRLWKRCTGRKEDGNKLERGNEGGAKQRRRRGKNLEQANDYLLSKNSGSTFFRGYFEHFENVTRSPCRQCNVHFIYWQQSERISKKRRRNNATSVLFLNFLKWNCHPGSCHWITFILSNVNFDLILTRFLGFYTLSLIVFIYILGFHFAFDC